MNFENMDAISLDQTITNSSNSDHDLDQIQKLGI